MEGLLLYFCTYFKAVSLFWTLKSEFTNCLNHDGDKLVLWTVWWTGARSAGLCRVTVVQSGPIMFHLLACWEAGRGLQGRDIGLLSFLGTGRRSTGPEFLVVNGLIVHVLNFHVMGTSTTGWCTADNLEEQAMCRVSLKVWVGARKMFGAFIPKMKFVGSK